KVFTGLATDMSKDDDTLVKVVENIAPIAPDYYTDFEIGLEGWSMYGTNSSLEIGIPSGTVISSAASGDSAVVSNLNGQYNNNETSYLQCPCMDFSSASRAPIMDFALFYDLDKDDQLWMEESYDGGVTWSKIDSAINSNNWYNNTVDKVWDGKSNGWIRVDNV